MKFPGVEPMGLEKDLITGSFLPQELGHPTSAGPHCTIKRLKSVELGHPTSARPHRTRKRLNSVTSNRRRYRDDKIAGDSFDSFMSTWKGSVMDDMIVESSSATSFEGESI
jgi:hypothetical protein